MKIAVLLMVAMLMSCTRASRPEVSSLKFDFSKISEKGSGLVPQSAIPTGSKVCYGVNVLASDIQGIPKHQCSPQLGIFKGFITEEETLSVDVPFGKEREVQLYAFLPKRGSPCVVTDGKEGGPEIDPQTVFLVGKLSNQVFDKEEVRLEMHVNFPGNDHSIYADLRMDSSCLNTSSPGTDPNAPVVVKAFLNNTTINSVGTDEFLTLNILVKSPNAPNQLTLNHDGPNGNISNGPNSQMFYACTLANINTAGHICEGSTVDNYYALKSVTASQWAPPGRYNLSFSVRSATFIDSAFFTGPSYSIINHPVYGAPTIENIAISQDTGLTSGSGGNVNLKILVQSTAAVDLLDKTVIRPDSSTMSMGTVSLAFTNCAPYISTPAHICYNKTNNHWYYELSEFFHPFLQNGTYQYKDLRVRNMTNLFSPTYSTLTATVSGNLTPITPTITKINTFYAFDNDPLTQGIPYYNSSCVRPEGSNAFLGLRVVATTNAGLNFISYTLQGPSSIVASGGQGISGVDLTGGNWQAEFSAAISAVMSATRGAYLWNNIGVKNIADQQSAVIQGPEFHLSDSCFTIYGSVSSYGAGAYTCGVSSSGKLKCWGSNLNHVIDHGAPTNRTYPTVVDGDESYLTVATGSVHTCATTTMNKLKCWGSNGNGQLGDGTFTASDKPKLIDTGTMYMRVSTGTNHTCGITSAGALKCWGRNIYGQLGDGTTIDKQVPTLIDSGTQYASVTAGDSYTCGITNAQVLKCWGQNNSYQLGDGTTNTRTTPTVINSGVTFSSIEAGMTSTCGITTTGSLKCWGQNTYGQLGDNTTTTRSAPTLIDSGTSYINVSTGYTHTCGITIAGVIKCWGQNTYGQLGDGTATNRLLPVIINAGVTYSSVTAGTSHTCGTTNGGFLKCWGQNLSNQLGNGNTSGSSLPLDIDL